MNKNIIIIASTVILLAIIGLFVYPKVFHSNPQRTILYWTDPMIPGDRSDQPGKSPMGMERVPVYADEVKSDSTLDHHSSPKEYYTCPMHPSVRSDKPGACPVCGMTLVKRTEDNGIPGEEHRAMENVTLSPSKQVLANVSTSIAKRSSLEKEIRAGGRIDYAEPNFKHISTRFPGRLEKLYLSYTGQKVNKGDPVAEIYSPEAISAQQEYLLAIDSYDQVKDAAEVISSGAKSLLDQSRQKLVLWGFTNDQIIDLEKTKTVKDTLIIYSPIAGTVIKKNVDPQHYAAAGEDIYDIADLSTVWMYADVYEYELHWLNIGQHVYATSQAYPGTVFTGEITFISPTIDPSTRTASIRVEFPNRRSLLKLEMFVDASIKIKLPETVVVPVSAVLSTGERQVVWVQKDQTAFEPHLVRIGARAGDFIQILEGLIEGETVVTSGGYLLDSESQMQATASTSDEHSTKKVETHKH
ncbi:MAG: efflux RND transporter periplasmic adaptor subunit [Ignavibacteria bacterium]|nr:efflux RND transporter periplasmic adaptor subunit [Ignavibacteria bacterium]MBI3764965.1 efflux RND transporter periplasmic adaptor subunit [Ignavibacteriales bacterium]